MAIPAKAEKVPVGVSQCLLGVPVRYDGGHTYDSCITQVLGRYFDYRPICPEVAIGLGVPRKPIRLVVGDVQTRVRGVENPELDVTDALTREAESTLDTLSDLSGYIFMQNSPSCGVHGVKRYTDQGRLLDTNGRGAFAKRLMECSPLLPVEEAGRLADARVRERFITCVFAYHDWRQSLGKNLSPDTLRAFYARYKSQILAQDSAAWPLMDQLLTDLQLTDRKERNLDAIHQKLATVFMRALRQ